MLIRNRWDPASDQCKEVTGRQSPRTFYFCISFHCRAGEPTDES
jgi:hypothetical protein